MRLLGNALENSEGGQEDGGRETDLCVGGEEAHEKRRHDHEEGGYEGGLLAYLVVEVAEEGSHTPCISLS